MLPAWLQAGADLHYDGPANQRRGRADTLSKILFQLLARTQPITLEALLQVAAAGAAPQGVAGAGPGEGQVGSIGVERAREAGVPETLTLNPKPERCIVMSD